MRESIGKHNLSPSLTFDNEGIIDIPVLKKDTNISTPGIDVNPDFNPFDTEKSIPNRPSGFQKKERTQDWEKIFQKNGKYSDQNQENADKAHNIQSARFMQLKNRYILTPVKSGLMIIDQKRAHERIIFEDSLKRSRSSGFTSQKLLFPESIELNTSDFVTFVDIKQAISELGFDIEEFGKNSIIVNGVPEAVKNSDIKTLIEEILEEYKSMGTDTGTKIKEKLAKSIARASSIPYGKVLEIEEMRDLVDQLFACSNPNHSPAGKPVISIIRTEEIEKSLKS